jgi:hypothetical protein
MKLSDKQAQMLLALLQSSLRINIIGYLCYSYKNRQKLLAEIINQQDESIKEIENEKNQTA